MVSGLPNNPISIGPSVTASTTTTNLARPNAQPTVFPAASVNSGVQPTIIPHNVGITTPANPVIPATAQPLSVPMQQAQMMYVATQIKNMGEAMRTDFLAKKNTEGWLGKSFDYCKNHMGGSYEDTTWGSPLYKLKNFFFDSDRGSQNTEEKLYRTQDEIRILQEFARGNNPAGFAIKYKQLTGEDFKFVSLPTAQQPTITQPITPSTVAPVVANNPVVQQSNAAPVMGTTPQKTNSNENHGLLGKTAQRIDNFKKSQDAGIDVIADTATGIVVAGTVTAGVAGGVLAAPFTAGTSFVGTAATIASAATLGSVVKTAIKGSDALSGGQDYFNKEKFGYDALTGFVMGGITPVATVAGSGATKLLFGRFASQALQAGTNRVVTTYSNELIGAAAGLTQSATEGAVFGAVDNPLRVGLDGGTAGEVVESIFTGAATGAILNTAIHGTTVGTGKLMSRLSFKPPSNGGPATLGNSPLPKPPQPRSPGGYPIKQAKVPGTGFFSRFFKRPSSGPAIDPGNWEVINPGQSTRPAPTNGFKSRNADIVIDAETETPAPPVVTTAATTALVLLGKRIPRPNVNTVSTPQVIPMVPKLPSAYQQIMTGLNARWNALKNWFKPNQQTTINSAPVQPNAPDNRSTSQAQVTSDSVDQSNPESNLQLATVSLRPFRRIVTPRTNTAVTPGVIYQSDTPVPPKPSLPRRTVTRLAGAAQTVKSWLNPKPKPPNAMPVSPVVNLVDPLAETVVPGDAPSVAVRSAKSTDITLKKPTRLGEVPNYVSSLLAAYPNAFPPNTAFNHPNREIANLIKGCFAEAIIKRGRQPVRPFVPTEAQLAECHQNQFYTFGWKIHLNVEPTENNPVTRAISDFLNARGIPFKIARGGENGKGLTARIGSYDTLQAVAKELNKQFGDQIPPAVGDILRNDVPIEGNIWARFHAADSPLFHQSGEGGLPWLDQDVDLNNLTSQCTSPQEMGRRADLVLRAQYGDFYTGTGANQIENALQLQNRIEPHHLTDGYEALNARFGKTLTREEWDVVINKVVDLTDENINAYFAGTLPTPKQGAFDALLRPNPSDVPAPIVESADEIQRQTIRKTHNLQSVDALLAPYPQLGTVLEINQAIANGDHHRLWLQSEILGGNEHFTILSCKDPQVKSPYIIDKSLESMYSLFHNSVDVSHIRRNLDVADLNTEDGVRQFLQQTAESLDNPAETRSYGPTPEVVAQAIERARQINPAVATVVSEFLSNPRPSSAQMDAVNALLDKPEVKNLKPAPVQPVPVASKPIATVNQPQIAQSAPAVQPRNTSQYLIQPRIALAETIQTDLINLCRQEGGVENLQTIEQLQNRRLGLADISYLYVQKLTAKLRREAAAKGSPKLISFRDYIHRLQDLSYRTRALNGEIGSIFSSGMSHDWRSQMDRDDYTRAAHQQGRLYLTDEFLTAIKQFVDKYQLLLTGQTRQVSDPLTTTGTTAFDPSNYATELAQPQQPINVDNVFGLKFDRYLPLAAKFSRVPSVVQFVNSIEQAEHLAYGNKDVTIYRIPYPGFENYGLQVDEALPTAVNGQYAHLQHEQYNYSYEMQIRDQAIAMCLKSATPEDYELAMNIANRALSRGDAAKVYLEKMTAQLEKLGTSNTDAVSPQVIDALIKRCKDDVHKELAESVQAFLTNSATGKLQASSAQIKAIEEFLSGSPIVKRTTPRYSLVRLPQAGAQIDAVNALLAKPEVQALQSAEPVIEPTSAKPPFLSAPLTGNQIKQLEEKLYNNMIDTVRQSGAPNTESVVRNLEYARKSNIFMSYLNIGWKSVGEMAQKLRREAALKGSTQETVSYSEYHKRAQILEKRLKQLNTYHQNELASMIYGVTKHFSDDSYEQVWRGVTGHDRRPQMDRLLTTEYLTAASQFIDQLEKIMAEVTH